MSAYGKESGGDNDGGRKDDGENFYGFSYDNGKLRSGNQLEEELEPLNKPEMENEKNEKLEGNVIAFPPIVNNNKDKDEMEMKGSGHERKPCDDFEMILDKVDGQGKYQKILVYAVLCPIVTLSPFLVLQTVFMWDTPDHWCSVPGRDSSMPLDEWKNISLPWETGPDGQLRHSQCNMIDQATGNVTKCQFGWEYDKKDYSSTVPSEYDWVCDKDYYATDCFTWGSIGSTIGTVIFGIMADKYGRKPVFFAACFTNLFFKSISLFFAHKYVFYKTLQLLGGFAFPALFSMPALIAAEVSGTAYRAWIYAVTWMIWVVGNALIPFVAKVCRGWFLFGCVSAVPGAFLFFYYPIVDESPRWLITVGKTERAVKIILKMAEQNKRTVDPDEIKLMVDELAGKQMKEQKTQSVGFWTLFSKFRLAKNTIMLIISWTMNSLLYYGVTLHTTHMAGDKFINYFILALIELPGGWVAGKLVEKTGRRWTQTALFLLCTLSCLLCAVAVTYQNSAIVVLIGALGIKFGVAITSLVAYLQGTEIFPTLLRSTGSGLASTVASAVGIFGPYIVYSGTIHVSFPYGILCLCSFFGLVSATFLPETFKQSLPETIEDANSFGKDHKFWSYLPQAREKSEGVDGLSRRRSSSTK